MITDILKNFGEYLITSAGYKSVYYNAIPEKGSSLFSPYAEIIIEDSEYPLQPNLGASAPAKSRIIFKSYFESNYDNGTLENLHQRSLKEIELFQMLQAQNFGDILQTNSNSFIDMEDIAPTTTIHTDINGIANHLILIEYRFTLVWRVV